MTDDEYNELIQLLQDWNEFKKKRPEDAKIFWKWRRIHDAAYFATAFPDRSEPLNKRVCPVLLSCKSDDEILAELNKIIPPNFRAL